jgi:RNA polymerase sigma-70 factor (ECF subfamily)
VAPHDDEPRLVERARRGDEAAYATLVRAGGLDAVAFRTACLLAGSAADAEDALQEALVKAWRALPRFRSGAPFRPWLLTIVANEARSRRRAAGRRAGWTLRAAVEAQTAEDAPSPEATVLVRERSRELAGALGALPERDRVVLVLRYVLDLSEREMAAVLDCRPGTVKSRLARALDRLREEVDA